MLIPEHHYSYCLYETSTCLAQICFRDYSLSKYTILYDGLMNTLYKFSHCFSWRTSHICLRTALLIFEFVILPIFAKINPNQYRHLKILHIFLCKLLILNRNIDHSVVFFITNLSCIRFDILALSINFTQ